MKTLALLLAFIQAEALEQIAGYQPRSNAVDYLIMDQDKKAMDSSLEIGELILARRMYELGGHSAAVANITLLNLRGAKNYKKGTIVTGIRKKTENGIETQQLVGTLLDDESWTDSSSNTTIHVLYATGETSSDIRDCKVGALYLTARATLGGCFNDTGTLTINAWESESVSASSFSSRNDEDPGDSFQYEYDIRFDNWNQRTFQSFSVDANCTMKACAACPYYDDFQTYVDYYLTPLYGEIYVMAASKNESTSFPVDRRNVDFSSLNSGGKIGHAEAMQEGNLVLNVWMEVVRHLNDAMENCEANETDASIHSLDAGIALYAGSEAGKDNSSLEGGRMLYNFANRRAHNTRTAGPEAEKPVGTAYVNHQIVKEFTKAQLAIFTDDCASALHSKRRIVALMKVPLIQSLLRYAYILTFDKPSVIEEEEKLQGENSAFLAAAIPHLYKCDNDGAETVYSMMRVVPTQDIDFPQIKAILERNYDCMGVSCPLIGGYYSAVTESYINGAEPCNFGTLEGPNLVSSGSYWSVYSGTTAVSLVVACIGVLF